MRGGTVRGRESIGFQQSPKLAALTRSQYDTADMCLVQSQIASRVANANQRIGEIATLPTPIPERSVSAPGPFPFLGYLPRVRRLALVCSATVRGEDR